jgi:hypothetical protein
MRHTAQSLQTPDHFLHGLRGQLHHFEDGLFQALNPRAHVLNFVQAIYERGLLRRLRVTHLLQPGQVTSCPHLQSQGWTPTRAEKELG